MFRVELNDIKTPQDIKRLNTAQLGELCELLRKRIVDVVEANGGHLASNLGAVELTVAMHYCFDCPTDKFIFDVGHQSYAHKLLTGRQEGFELLRKNGGVSGFPQPEESECDAFGTGHASTSLSVALGFAEAAVRRGENSRAVALIGDGALTGGMAYEALNAIGSEQLPVVIILNDNNMSISKNVGAMSKYLTRLRVSKRYASMKSQIRRAVSIIPIFGDGTLRLLERCKQKLKRVVLSGKMFEAMGITYYGPFDGHNISELINVFTGLKDKKEPVIIHVLTDKGRGLRSASTDPEHTHGISSQSTGSSFSAVLGKFLTEAADTDNRITAVTAAMSIGTGLEDFAKAHPKKFKDVGIAEEHAVTYCAALAAGGLKPYFAVYSTFLQRAFDQTLHDVCIGNYPVTFCIDRAGAVGSDGVTHQGLFDLSYLLLMPNMTVMCPTDGKELRQMLDFSLEYNGPLAIRYPKTYSVDREHAPIEYGKWECAKAGGHTYVLCAGGRALDIALQAAEEHDITVVNTRFVKPLDSEFLVSINKPGNNIITVEDNVAAGGFGSATLAFLNCCGLKARVHIIAHGDSFCDDRDVASALDTAGISLKNLTDVIKSLDCKDKN